VAVADIAIPAITPHINISIGILLKKFKNEFAEYTTNVEVYQL